jgi:hypothetical protein
MLIFRILVLDDRALPASARRPHCRMPAKIGKIKAQGQAGGQQIIAVLNDISATIYFDASHYAVSVTALLPKM